MKKFKAKFNLILAALLLLSLFIPNAAASAKTITPQIRFVKAPAAAYTAGSRVSFVVQAPNYSGKVEYRVVLWNCTKKTSTDLWTKSNGHPTHYYRKSSGKSTFALSWIIKEPGTYKIIVYVKRAGISSSKLAVRKAGCDSYKESAVFTVKPIIQMLTLSKQGASYGSSNPLKMSSFKGYVKIVNKSISYSNANVDGNLYVNADSAVLNNVNVKGTLVINPGSGTVTLNKVTANIVYILSGNTANLNNVNGNELLYSSKTKTEIIIDKDTVMDHSKINADAALSANGGSFGNIHVGDINTKEILNVNLKGTFDKDIYADADSTFKTIDDTTSVNNIIATEFCEVDLYGKFNNIQLVTGAAVLNPSTTVSKVVSSGISYLVVDKGAVVDTIDSTNGILYLENEGTVNQKSGTIISQLTEADLPDQSLILGNANAKIDFGSEVSGDYKVGLLYMHPETEDGTPISITQGGKLYMVFNGQVMMFNYNDSSEHYSLLLNDDGTIALPGGTYTMYLPVNDKWYKFTFTTKQIGSEGENSSELTTVNGQPYTYTRYIPQ